MVRMLGSLGLGAALMYLFDPRSGRRRRARLRDGLVHTIASERHLLDKARRDFANRAHAVRLGSFAGLSAPAPRVVLGAAGALLVVRGGTLARIGGAAMLVRAIANDELARIVGIRPATVAIDKTITIDAPVDRVFALWTKIDRFPVFLEHVRAVHHHAPGRSQWVVDGPLGVRAGFEAEIVQFERDRLVSWRTLPGSDLEHEGSVRFDEVDHGTRIHIQLRYRPPGGLAGHALARLLRFDPRSRLDDDALRAKALLEHGKTRAHQHRVRLGDIPPYS